jgi:phosphoglycerate dehydrogenase-like enzyme
MDIIIINRKSSFTPEQIKTLSSAGNLTFIETADYTNHPALQTSKDKVIAVGPELIQWQLTNETLQTIKQLKAVCLPTTSFAWVDGHFLRSKNIPLSNVPYYSTESVAEYAISLMLNLVKKIPMIMNNNWILDHELHKGWEIKNKIMGIIGLGHIGKRIAQLGKALGMNVIYWSKNSRDDAFKYTELDELLKTADFVFPALARNEGTNKILDNEKLNLIKVGGFLISITGVDLFDVHHAIEMVQTNKLNGLAFESDKYTINSTDFKNLKGNILVTPSIAWYTYEASQKNMELWTENILSAIKGTPLNVVN